MTLFWRFLEEGTDSADNDKTQTILLSQLYDSFVIREAVTGGIDSWNEQPLVGQDKTSTRGRRGRIWTCYWGF